MYAAKDESSGLSGKSASALIIEKLTRTEAHLRALIFQFYVLFDKRFLSTAKLGDNALGSVRPSVRLSVCLSVLQDLLLRLKCLSVRL